LQNVYAYANQQIATNRSLGAQPQVKITINLEDALLEEQKLHGILESLRDNQNASLICDDWWDLTESIHFVTVIANQVIKDPILRQTILRT